jgi:orotidine-5'-phosphate decarboxylase
VLNNPVYASLKKNIDKQGHCICLGLDPDLEKIPSYYEKTIKGLEAFLLDVIAASKDHVIAYKPNISFFEAYGIDGLRLLEKCRKKIPSDIPFILDAKRGDIGNTAAKQATYLFDYFGADAVTVNPYMGYDSIAPFLNYEDKLIFVLALTSNPGAKDFESLRLESGKRLFEEVIEKTNTWAKNNVGFVVGATQAYLEHVRALTPYPFLIPGVGHQGGSYADAKKGRDTHGVAIINVSRAFLYSWESPKDLDLTIKHLIKSMLS